MPRGGDKDPNKPRGRTSSYAFFIKARRELVKGQSVDFKEFSQQCSALWKNLPANEKAKYDAMAAKDKKRFDQEMKHYVPPKGTKGKGKRKGKDPNAPKKGLTAFLWFSKDYRTKVKEENPSYTVGDIAKALGVMWGNLDDRQKSKYTKMAADDKKRYDKQMEEYKKKGKAAPVAQEESEEEEEDDDEEEEDDED